MEICLYTKKITGSYNNVIFQNKQYNQMLLLITIWSNSYFLVINEEKWHVCHIFRIKENTCDTGVPSEDNAYAIIERDENSVSTTLVWKEENASVIVVLVEDNISTTIVSKDNKDFVKTCEEDNTSLSYTNCERIFL